jgi:hypothetical protein
MVGSEPVLDSAAAFDSHVSKLPSIENMGILLVAVLAILRIGGRFYTSVTLAHEVSRPLSKAFHLFDLFGTPIQSRNMTYNYKCLFSVLDPLYSKLTRQRGLHVAAILPVGTYIFADAAFIYLRFLHLTNNVNTVTGYFLLQVRICCRE